MFVCSNIMMTDEKDLAIVDYGFSKLLKYVHSGEHKLSHKSHMTGQAKNISLCKHSLLIIFMVLSSPEDVLNLYEFVW
jgi:hypothetical protein